MYKNKEEKMSDYIRRFLNTGFMALCVTLSFFGVLQAQANTVDIKELTPNWMWPSDGVITDLFGTRQGHHKGIDIAAPIGSQVYAVENGVVSKSYYSDTYGNVVFIKHDNEIETVYAHLKERKVHEGAIVQQGEEIGEMGSTGDSSGVHLHFEVHLSKWTFDKSNAINPLLALGEVKVGQAVAAIKKDEPEYVLETSALLEKNETIEQTQNKSDPIYSQYHSDEKDQEQTNYIVQNGETLWSISNEFQTTVHEIQEQNGLETNQIKVGQALSIPVKKGKNIYVVQKGDTLTSISKKSNIRLDRLREMNHLTEDVIKPQQILILSQ
jgi:murein DD-endopeptidase MepM/ murein hydrolase activator NlpD